MPIRIEIFPKPESDKTPTLMLNTRISPHGTFEVFACGRAGEKLPAGMLWSLRSNGRQECWSDINPKLGLDLDEKGKIRDA